MTDAAVRPESEERRRRSFRLLTYVAAVVASSLALVVTVTQFIGLRHIVDQTAGWWWKYLGLPSVALPILLGVVVVIGSVTLGWHGRQWSRHPGRVTEPIRPDSALERFGWRVCEVHLVLYPITVALLPLALTSEARGVLSQTGYHVIAMYSMVATLLASVGLSGLRRWIYLVLVQAVTALTFLSASTDPARAGIFTLSSLAMCIVVMAAALTLESVAYTVDDARAADEERRVETSSLAARLGEAARIDALVHDHILSALLLTSRASVDGDPAWRDETMVAVRKHAATALDTLDDIARPAQDVRLAPLTPAAMQSLLDHQTRAIDPGLKVVTTGTRTAPVPGDVAHTIVAAACEAVRNSLRHSGSTSGSGAPVSRRVMLHHSEVGVTTTVLDDGSGFDPGAIPERRLGVRGSILNRMDTIPGGSAQIDSTLGEGTRVSLSWVDPRLSTSPQPHRRLGPDLGKDLLDDSADPSMRVPHIVLRHSSLLLALSAAAIGLCFAGMAALTRPLFHPAWISPVCLALLTLAGVYTLARVYRVARNLPVRSTWLLAVVSPTIVALGVWGYRGHGMAGIEIWQVVAATIALVGLTFSGNGRPAILGTIACVLIVAFMPTAVSLSTGARAAVWISVASMVAVADQLARWVSGQMGIAARMQTERADRHARENEHLEALAARQERSRELDDLARPLLTSLAGGARLTPEIRDGAASLEAELRNGLRAKYFRGTRIVPAARQAFRRGVSVELMDDGALAGASEGVRRTVEDLVLAEIAAACDGSVIVRVLPPGREALVTVLRRADDGRLDRVEVLPDGTVFRPEDADRRSEASA